MNKRGFTATLSLQKTTCFTTNMLLQHLFIVAKDYRFCNEIVTFKHMIYFAKKLSLLKTKPCTVYIQIAITRLLPKVWLAIELALQ